MSVILTVALQDQLGGGGGGRHGLGATGRTCRCEVRDLMASAFAHTYWWAFALIVPAIVVAFLLPRVKPEPIEDDEPGADEPAPVLMHA